ncbi:MAG: hypothetical protein ACI9WU_003390 [Myxococcota bacterium]|jgi:hypothetical protein
MVVQSFRIQRLIVAFCVSLPLALGAQEAPPATDPPAADPPSGMTLTPKDRATGLARAGAKLAQQGQYAEAASKFQQSILVFPMTDVYYNLAYCYEQVGNWKGCVDHYQTYLTRYAKENDGADPAEGVSIKRSIEKCRETAQPPITIESRPAGARVALGTPDRMIGTTPLTQKLEPGSYKLFISKEGFKSVETQIVVQPKQEGRFLFELQRIVNSGTVRVTVNVREATIYIDGKNYGLSPYKETPELPVGSHQLVVRKERYDSVNTSFVVRQGETSDLSYEMVLTDPEPSWRSYLGWTSVSLGLIGVAGGVVASRFAEDEFNDTKAFEDLELIQNVGYGAGGGLVGVGVVLLIWEAFSDDVDSDDLIPNVSVSPTRGGAFVSGGVQF